MDGFDAKPWEGRWFTTVSGMLKCLSMTRHTMFWAMAHLFHATAPKISEFHRDLPRTPTAKRTIGKPTGLLDLNPKVGDSQKGVETDCLDDRNRITRNDFFSR